MSPVNHRQLARCLLSWRRRKKKTNTKTKTKQIIKEFVREEQKSSMYTEMG